MDSLAQRQSIPELMDAPDLPEAAHGHALAGLCRLNHISGASKTLAQAIARLGRVRNANGITLLDVACGGGDVPLGVACRLRRMGKDVQLTLTDRSATALGRAEMAAREADIGASTMPGTAPEGLPEGMWYIVTNSLFLHHLSRSEAVATLAAMARRARVAVLVSDLRRSVMGWAVAWLMCRLVTRSPIVHYDGPVSVRAAWTVEELAAMAEEAGLHGARVKACWPWRVLIVWERP